MYAGVLLVNTLSQLVQIPKSVDFVECLLLLDTIDGFIGFSVIIR